MGDDVVRWPRPFIALDADGVLLDYGLAHVGAWQKAFGQLASERDPFVSVVRK